MQITDDEKHYVDWYWVPPDKDTKTRGYYNYNKENFLVIDGNTIDDQKETSATRRSLLQLSSRTTEKRKGCPMFAKVEFEQLEGWRFFNVS